MAVLVGVGVAASQADRRRHVSLIVRSETVVTMDAARRILSPGAIAIDGDAIVAIDAADTLNRGFVGGEVLDLGSDVVLPGLVNTHGHVPMVLFRGLADDLALMDWLEHYIFPAEAKTVTRTFVRTGGRLGILEMIRSGTTTFADMYYFEEELAEVARAAGIRSVLGQSVIAFPAPDAATPAEALARATSFVEAWKDDPLVTPAVAPHSMYTLDEVSLTAARDLARRHGVPVLIHLAETKEEVEIARERYAMSPAEYLESIGFWGPGVLAAHGVWLTPSDIEILASRQVAVSHNPESNMKLASGIAPVPGLLAAGVVVGLGTDGAASNNDLDMFEAMREAALLHKVATGDPRVVPAPQALAMATIDGARALGLDDRVGSLEVGKRADLISVSTRGARQTPLYEPVSHLVYVARGHDVRTSIVNGRMLMRDGVVLTLDEATVVAEAREMMTAVRAAIH